MDDFGYMDIAYSLAEKAYKKDEVPVGAIIVRGDKIVSRAYNMREHSQNALHHAEIIAIDKACKKLKTFRLNECTLYVTLEPCPMCAGAIVNARIGRVVYGARDKKAGCFGTLADFNSIGFNHKPNVTYLDVDKCGKILTQYFVEKRK